MLAEFIAEGHFARHIRRMRTLYLERAEALAHEAARQLAGAITVAKPQAGMHTIGWLTDGPCDRDVSRRAADAGIVAWALSASYRHAAVAPLPAGLILGFAAYREEEIADAIRTLARVF